MPGHMGIDGNETAEQVARQGFSHSTPACAISVQVPRERNQGLDKYET
jgi:hypothetical protein